MHPRARAEATEYYEKTELTTPRSLEKLPPNCAGAAWQFRCRPATPNVDPESLLEPFEGMLVAFEDLQGVVQGPTKRSATAMSRSRSSPIRPCPSYKAGGSSNPTPPMPRADLPGQRAGADLPPVAWGDRVQVRAAEPGWRCWRLSTTVSANICCCRCRERRSGFSPAMNRPSRRPAGRGRLPDLLLQRFGAGPGPRSVARRGRLRGRAAPARGSH